MFLIIIEQIMEQMSGFSGWGGRACRRGFAFQDRSPLVIKRGRYMPPLLPGYSVTMKEESLDRFEYPTGAEWAN